MKVLNGSSVYNLDDEKVTHFTTWKGVISVHTEHEEFIAPTTLWDLLLIYKNFTMVDRSSIANDSKVMGYSESRKGLYFEKQETSMGKIGPIAADFKKEYFEMLKAKAMAPQEKERGIVKVLDKDNNVIYLDESEISFFLLHSREITLFTTYREYQYPVFLEQFHSLYSHLGFTWADRSCIVRLDKIKGYNKERKGVYFTDGDVQKIKVAPVSRPHNYKVIMKYLETKK